MILFRVKDDASQFQNFRVNFDKFRAWFPARLSQLSKAVTTLRKMGSGNAGECAQNALFKTSLLFTEFGCKIVWCAFSSAVQLHVITFVSERHITDK
jgi:hypothetical protein